MNTFTAKTFTIPTLKGLSAKTIEEHLKLYQGYVNNSNNLINKLSELRQNQEANAYIIGELSRRLSFEYNGMRNHEVYFASLSGGTTAPKLDNPLEKAVAETWGSFETWLAAFKSMAATTRGIGWAVLWYDRENKKLLTTWVDEQHLGLLQDCTMILGLDMWEHSYVADYQPSGKKNYIEDFFANLNWSVIEERFREAAGL